MWKDEGGFTLVEVLVSVLIISIAIIPLTYVFTHVAKGTIDGNEMLEINKLAVMYMENIKSRSIDEYSGLFNVDSSRNGEISLSADDDLEALSLPDIPDKYIVRLSYNESDLYTRPLDSSDNEILPALSPDVVTDCLISMDKEKSALMIYDEDGNAQDNSMYPDEFGKRKIKISLNSEENTIRTEVLNDDITLSSLKCSANNKNVVLDIGEDIPNTSEATEIEVSSDLSGIFSVYVFEDGNDTDRYYFKVVSGKVNISRNLRKASDVNVNLLSAKVEILEKSNGNILLELKGSVSNE